MNQDEIERWNEMNMLHRKDRRELFNHYYRMRVRRQRMKEAIHKILLAVGWVAGILVLFRLV